MSFRHPLRAACLAPLCLIVQLAFLVAPHAAYAVGTADGYVSVGTTTNPTSEFGVYGGATIGSSYNNILAPTNGLLVQGNVGIGTTSPSAPLHIIADTTAQEGIRIQRPGVPTQYLALNEQNNGSHQIQAYGDKSLGITNYSTNYGIQFYVNNGTNGALTIGKTGFIGIGSTSPQSLLDVESSGTVIFNNSSVGIGTTAPQSKLHIQSGEVQVGSSGATCSAANAGAISYASGALSYCNGSAWTSTASGNGSTGYDALWTSPTAIGTGLIYESGGKVGIGTASPTRALESYSTTYGYTGIFYGNSGGAAAVALGGVNGVGTVSAYTTDSLTVGTTLSLSGPVSIGTTATSVKLGVASGMIGLDNTYGLQIKGTGGSLRNAISVDSSNNLNIGDINLTGNIAFSTNSAQPLTVTSAGNVGVGTTSPVATLDVNGYAHLAKNSSQPVACDAAHDGSLALASTRRPCECVSSAWLDVVYGTACSW